VAQNVAAVVVVTARIVAKMRVEIWSDVVCPWCYIGKRRFERALAGFEHRDDVEVVFKPFQLDPNAPTVATPVLDAYARKFGGPERAQEIIERVTTAAAGEGLDFHLDVAQRANTLDAHRVLDLALERGVQADVKERLLQAYFSEGRDVADHRTLVELGAASGLDPDEVAALLAGDDRLAAVLEARQEAAELGITAVPTYVLADRWAVAGAQDPDVFGQVLDRAWERLRTA
jgi:predicted DsbA family dithiol-disulfide isomerase